MNTTHALPWSRSGPGIIVAGVVGTVLAAVLVAWQPAVGLIGVAAALLGLACFIRPTVGLALSLLTLALGQTVRLPLLGAEAAVLPNDLIFPVVILAWVLRQVLRGASPFPTQPLTRPLLFVLGAFVLSLTAAALRGVFTERQLLVAGLYVLRWVEYLFLFFVARSVVRPETLRRWLWFFGGITLALAILGFVQLVIYPDFSAFVPQGWDPHVGRLLSTWYDPNFLAGFFAVSLLIFLALLHEQTTDRWLAAVVVGVTLAALVLTFSRSGYVGFLVGFGVLAFLRARHFLAVGALTALLVFLFVPRVQERVIGIRSVDETAQLRLQSWRNALTVVADHPWVGVGYNTYRYVQVDYGFLKDPAEHSAGGSDSSFLTILVTTGLVGLVGYLALLVRTLAVTWRTSQTARDPTQRALGYGLLAGLVALIVHGQFVNGLLYPHLMEIQWVLLGWLLGARETPSA